MAKFTLKIFAAVTIVLSLLANGCNKALMSNDDFAMLSREMTVDVGGGSIDFAVEIADTPQKRARGLMGRKTLLPNSGMLFIFERSDHHIFWMKNTLISLDLIFFDEAFNVVGIIENTVPYSERLLDIRENSRSVLEVVAGTAKRYGISKDSSARLK